MRLLRSFIGLLVAVTLPLWAIPLGWRLAFSDHWLTSELGGVLIAFEPFCLLPLAAAALVLLWTPIALLRPDSRRRAPRNALVAAVLFSSIFGGIALGRLAWRAGVERTIARGAPLAAAVHAYTADRSQPPESLAVLVPKYIGAIPTTGVGAFPEFHYERNPRRYEGNPWALEVTPPNHILGFDVLLYFPLQNYPKHGFGGGIERIADWGYVHE